MNHFTTAQFDGISVAVAIYVPPGGGTSIHRNRPFHGFAFNCGKSALYAFDNNNELLIPRGSMIYFPKGSNYDVKSVFDEASDEGIYAINFQTTNALDIPEFKFTPKNTEKFLKDFKDAEFSWKTRSLGYYEKCCKTLYDIIYHMKQEMAGKYMPSHKKNIILPAIDYINEHYTYENINITLLAQLCNVSEVYLRQIFHNVYGMSPLKYINQLKLLRAKELIESREYTIGEAALQSGFFNDSYFSREFRKEFGMSPKEFFTEVKGEHP